LHDTGTRGCFIAAHGSDLDLHELLLQTARRCSPFAAVSTRIRAGIDIATSNAVLTMHFPDERCCDRSGADGAPNGAFDTAAPSTSIFPDALAGSQSCGGFLHPAAALLKRVLQQRANVDPFQLAL